jgi:hypothetical protein
MNANSFPPTRFLLCLTLGATLLAGMSGCTRRFFRRAADKEVVEVLTEKDRLPAWKIENWYVYPDSRSRYADTTNPDRPPMPPDDPVARDLAPNPQRPGKAGVARVGGTGYLELLAAWDAQNRAARGGSEEAEPPAVLPPPEKSDRIELLPPPKGEKGEKVVPPGAKEEPPELLPPPSEERPARPRSYLLTLEQATEMGLINSREYQTRREDLYLAALPVTLERFAFTAQFFAVEQAFREWAGRDLPRSDRNRWRLNGQAGFSKVFPTGALLLLRFANQTVVNLTGTAASPTLSTSTLGLDIVQPLLAGAGKPVTLEPLTQTERNLLYEIRDYARFRKEFYVAVATGQGVGRGVAGAVGIGLLGGGGIPTALGEGVRPAVVPGSGRVSVSTTGVITVTPQGYLPVVLLRAQLANEERNLQVLREYEEKFRQLYRAQLVDQAQYNQIRQQRFGSYATVLQRTADLGNSLDRFKIQLGLPTELPLELDATPLRPVLDQIDAYEEAYGFKDMKTRVTPAARALREVNEALKVLTPDPVERLRPAMLNLVRTSPLLAGTVFQEDFPRRWAEWEKIPTSRPFWATLVRELSGWEILDDLPSRLERLGRERRDKRDQQTRLETADQPVPEELIRRLQELDLEIDIGVFELHLRVYEGQPWKLPTAPAGQQQILFDRVMDPFRSFLFEVREAILDKPRRDRLRYVQENWPVLPRVCLNGVDLIDADEETALAVAGEYALANRFDLMNVRASVVDVWRKIAIAANSLLGTFNIEYHLESSTPSGQAKPLAFSAGRTRHQLIFNTELPLVRKLERNNYRATLIAYQRQRRLLMEVEDQILATVRAEVRQLRAQARNYREIQEGFRQQLDLAYFQLDLASNFVDAPPQPTGPGTPAPGFVGPPTAGRGAGGDPVALTQQLLNALTSLVRSKNQLYQVWIDYQTFRLQLYRDLELMPLDFRGVWIDDTANCHCSTPTARRPEQRPEQLPEPRPVPAPPGPAPGPAR